MKLLPPFCKQSFHADEAGRQAGRQAGKGVNEIKDVRVENE